MSRSVRRLVVASLAITILTGAGQPPEKKDDKKDPQATFEPRAKPGVGQEFLEKFVGDWEVAKTFHPRAGEPLRQKGECRQTMIHDGRFLKSDFVFVTDGGKSTGTGLIGFEPATGTFTTVWVDSRQTRMSFRQSEGKFENGEIVLFGKELGGKEGRRSKTVTRPEDDGKKIVHRQFSFGPDGKERLVMELVLTKKAVPAPPGK
ncbi:MAG: uncharacterized protein JWO38_5470 [Gemmataceae bacterium]|nr:uncharacterized protein [Gemmataceae bacterium]